MLWELSQNHGVFGICGQKQRQGHPETPNGGKAVTFFTSREMGPGDTAKMSGAWWFSVSPAMYLSFFHVSHFYPSVLSAPTLAPFSFSPSS